MDDSPLPVRLRRGVLVAACAVGVVTALLRYLALAGFPNDQYEHLAGAQQILMGEWPNRDFFDPGMPLTYVMSALAQLLLGRTLFAEAVLNAAAFGVAAALTMVGAYRLSKSVIVALVAAAFCVAIFPRPYAYPKTLLCATGPLVMWAWMSRPTLGRMIAMAGILVIGFLFRYDYGVYLGAAALMTTALAPAERWAQRVSRVATLCALVAVLLAPYALYIQQTEGMASAIRGVLEYGRRHGDRTQLHLFDQPWNQELGLFYAFHALPLVALAWSGLDRLRGRPAHAPVIVPLSVLAIVINIGFLRDPLSARLADAIVPVSLLGAWLASRAGDLAAPAGRVAAVAVVIVLVVLGANSVMVVANTRDQFRRSGLGSGLSRTSQLLADRTEELTARMSRQQVPDGRLIPLFPLFEYFHRCTTAQHRLLVTAYAPELYVYSGRLFAGGQKVFMEGYQNSAEAQARTVERMRRQTVLFVLAPSDSYEQWQHGFALVSAYVDSHFRHMVDIPVSQSRSVRVFVNYGIPATATYAATGWPCYT
jgi:hypothetical protein